MKKNAMIQAFINTLLEDKFVVIPDLLIEDFKESMDQVKVEGKRVYYSGGVYLLPQESKEYPLGGQGFYID